MRHAHLTTAGLYTPPRLDDLLDKLAAHYGRPPAPPAWAPGYAPEDVRTAAAPATMHAAAVRGQLTVTEMVSRYPIRNAEVRALLIDYIARRSPELDYPSIDALARELAGLFWARIETINPGQQDLQLDDHVYEQWRTQIAVRDDGSPRLHQHHILMSVRSLYLDLQGWAHAEPGRWARWAARCPVRQAELSQVPARRRRISERMADRTRQRQPLLPVLIDHLDQQLSGLHGLLAAARMAGPGQEFSHDGRAYRRTDTGYDRKRDRFDGTRPVRIRDLTDGRTVNVAEDEDQAFWQWAIAETLRHSGCGPRN